MIINFGFLFLVGKFLGFVFFQRNSKFLEMGEGEEEGDKFPPKKDEVTLESKKSARQLDFTDVEHSQSNQEAPVVSSLTAAAAASIPSPAVTATRPFTSHVRPVMTTVVTPIPPPPQSQGILHVPIRHP